MHSEDLSLNENEHHLDAEKSFQPDEHHVDPNKPPHSQEDSVSSGIPPLSGSDSESDVSCKDTDSPNYHERAKRSALRKSAVLDGRAPKKVMFQDEVSRQSSAGDPSDGSVKNDVESSQPTPGGPKTNSASTNGLTRDFLSRGEPVLPTIPQHDGSSSQPTSTQNNLEPLVLQPIYEHQILAESVSKGDSRHEQVTDPLPQPEAAPPNVARKSVSASPSNSQTNAPQPSASVASDPSKTPPKPAPLSKSQAQSSKQGRKPVFKTKKRESNLVNLSEIGFKFVLHERLPLQLHLKPDVKDTKEREKNFELLKAWVDFRHYLFATLDPRKEQYIADKSKIPYDIFNRHVKKLIMLQKNNKIDSVFSETPAHLNAILATADVTEPAQPSNPIQVKAEGIS